MDNYNYEYHKFDIIRTELAKPSIYEVQRENEQLKNKITNVEKNQ